jgi:hypothetical protein
MQPQEPGTGKPSYDFIFNEGTKQTGRKLPKLSGPLLWIAIAVVLIVVIIIFGTLLGGKKAKTTGLTDVLGKAQEITRVNALEQAQLNDAVAVGLMTTSQSVLTSDQVQLKKYMTDHKIKVDPKKLATYQNKDTDTQLTAAAQNNNLPVAYISYLRRALTDYANTLSTAYSGTSDQGTKTILKAAYDSSQTLLASPVLKAGS